MSCSDCFIFITVALSLKSHAAHSRENCSCFQTFVVIVFHYARQHKKLYKWDWGGRPVPPSAGICVLLAYVSVSLSRESEGCPLERGLWQVRIWGGVGIPSQTCISKRGFIATHNSHRHGHSWGCWQDCLPDQVLDSLSLQTRFSCLDRDVAVRSSRLPFASLDKRMKDCFFLSTLPNSRSESHKEGLWLDLRSPCSTFWIHLCGQGWRSLMGQRGWNRCAGRAGSLVAQRRCSSTQEGGGWGCD